MTSRGSNGHDSGFIGHVRVQPPLNAAERAHLEMLSSSNSTLRGTPTGRGDRDVPFAHLAWEVCADGCCLMWNPELEASRMMLPTLQFVIDHLLRRGARAEGRKGFDGFTFDHVLDGALLGCAPGDVERRFVAAVGNSVYEHVQAKPCDPRESQPPTRSAGRTRRGRLPANVIEFRPRRA